MNSKNWIRRIVYFQEKRSYHFYTILIFALFVGSIRSLEEILLAHRMYESAHVFNNCAFYFLIIWSFTLLVTLLTGVAWRKAIHAVLIGVFLGIFPPIIDVLIYGIGGFRYGYFTGMPSLRQLLLFEPSKGFPIGEGGILWATTGFTAYYVWLKTGNWIRTLLGGIFAYALLLNAGWIIPSVGAFLESRFHVMYIILLSILQILTAVIFYFLLNPAMAARLLTRSLHCVPFILLTFLGSALSGGITPMSFIMAGLVLFAGIVTLAQNDYYDKDEDALEGRVAYIDRHDVLFFNTTFLALMLLLYNTGGYLYLPLVTMFICSVLYNYDFYRAKRFFPGNYKIEGIWGMGSFLAGIMCQGAIVFSKEILIYTFLVFGGWSLVSTFKDYKDIEADRNVGNQTGYVMLMKTGLSLEQAHKIVSMVMILCFCVPAVWLFFLPVPRIWSILFPIIMIGALALTLQKPPSKSVVKGLLIITSAYLLVLLLLLVKYLSAV